MKKNKTTISTLLFVHQHIAECTHLIESGQGNDASLIQTGVRLSEKDTHKYTRNRRLLFVIRFYGNLQRKWEEPPCLLVLECSVL